MARNTQAKQWLKCMLFNGTVVFLLLPLQPRTGAAETSCLWDGKAYTYGAVVQMGVKPVNVTCFPNGWWATDTYSNGPSTWTRCEWKSQTYSPGAMVLMYPNQKANISCYPDGSWH